MFIAVNDYVPILKWRQGEYQALSRLDDTRKSQIVPLIEITPPEFDFELWKPKRTIDEHLITFAPRFGKKWGRRPALLDAGLIEPTVRMSDGQHPLLWLMERARRDNANLLPVTALDRDADYQRAAWASHAVDRRGVVLRSSLEDCAAIEFEKKTKNLAQEMDLSIDEIDLIIDLKSPNFEPIDGLAELLVTLLGSASIFSIFRSVTIAATAFPTSMSEIRDSVQFVSRREWLLYKALCQRLPEGARKPTFGDYTIATPGLAQGDMRLLRPSATVRYAVNNGWIIAKGSSVRDNGYLSIVVAAGQLLNQGIS